MAAKKQCFIQILSLYADLASHPQTETATERIAPSLCVLSTKTSRKPTSFSSAPSAQVTETSKQKTVKYQLISKLSPQRLPCTPVFCLPLAGKEWGLPTQGVKQFIKTFAARTEEKSPKPSENSYKIARRQWGCDKIPPGKEDHVTGKYWE